MPNALDKRKIEWVDLMHCIDDSCRVCFEQLGRCKCMIKVTITREKI